MKLAIGCPIRDRSWIIDPWFFYLDQALKELGGELDVSFFFVAAKNEPSLLSYLGRDDINIINSEEEVSSYERRWDLSAYSKMTDLRNNLLKAVRKFNPDYFLSLDSDILLHPLALVNMFELMDKFNPIAVGGKCYMQPVGRSAPSYGVWNDHHFNRFHRPDSDGFMSVDILMAIKLMSRSGYNTDYTPHELGEDCGWSIAAKQLGKLYWDGRVTSKHVMSQEWLNRLDKRCGF